MDISRISDRDLLVTLIGLRATEKLYQGRLAPLFTNDDTLTVPRVKLLAARELVTRMFYEELRHREVLGAPDQVKRYLVAKLSHQEHESFHVLFLDAQNRLIVGEEVFRGTLMQTAVYPREVVKLALRYNAAALILAHNHPSGVAEPSRADLALTESLKKALELLDVRILDHFVVAGNVAVSLAERGVLV